MRTPTMLVETQRRRRLVWALFFTALVATSADTTACGMLLSCLKLVTGQQHSSSARWAVLTKIQWYIYIMIYIYLYVYTLITAWSNIYIYILCNIYITYWRQEGRHVRMKAFTCVWAVAIRASVGFGWACISGLLCAQPAGTCGRPV